MKPVNILCTDLATLAPRVRKSEISPETLIYGIFPDTILRDSVFANGGADAQWIISIPKTYSKSIPYSNPNPFPNTNTFLIPKFDKKCLKRNRLKFTENARYVSFRT